MNSKATIPTSKREYLVTVIHNFDPLRKALMVAELERLSSTCPKDTSLDLNWVGFQRLLAPVNLSKRLQRWRLQKKLALQMILQIKSSSKIKSLIWWVISTPVDIRHITEAWSKRSVKPSIELELTKKHIRSWEAFLDSEADYLIVLEDDASLSTDFWPTIAEILDLEAQGGVPVAVSLSSDYSLRELGIEEDIDRQEPTHTVFKTGVVNTTAGYILNREAADAFVAGVHACQKLQLLNSDYLMNKLLLGEPKVKCVHALKPLVTNGSVAGRTKTSILG